MALRVAVSQCPNLEKKKSSIMNLLIEMLESLQFAAARCVANIYNLFVRDENEINPLCYCSENY